MRNFILIISFLLSALAFGQVGIGTTSVSSDVILEVAPNNTAILLPKVDNVSNITLSQRAMLVYDDVRDGVRGYFSPDGNTTLKWGNLFLNEDIVTLKKVTTSSADYTRDKGKEDTWEEMSDLRTNITVNNPNTLITAQFGTSMRFQQDCFRGSVKIEIENSSGTVVATVNGGEGILFNYGGDTSRYSQFPFDVALRYAAPAKGNYTIKVHQNPTTTTCRTEGSFLNPTLIINHY
ncbi:MAG: hypothetical protein ACK5IC_10795 [Moheibacter sp.]